MCTRLIHTHTLMPGHTNHMRKFIHLCMTIAHSLQQERDPDLYYLVAKLNALDQGVTTWSKATDVGAAALVPVLQPWCEVAFAGVIRIDALLYVWDQLFIVGWDHLAEFGTELIHSCWHMFSPTGAASGGKIKKTRIRTLPEFTHEVRCAAREMRTRDIRVKWAP